MSSDLQDIRPILKARLEEAHNKLRVLSERAISLKNEEDAILRLLSIEEERFEGAQQSLSPEPVTPIGVSKIDADLDKQITDLLLEGKSVRTIFNQTKASLGIIHARRARLIAEGKLTPRGSGNQALTPKETQRRFRAVREAIIELDERKEKISYSSIAEESGISQGALSPILQFLKEKQFIEILDRSRISNSEMREKGAIRLLKPKSNRLLAEQHSLEKEEPNILQEPQEEEEDTDRLTTRSRRIGSSAAAIWKAITVIVQEGKSSHLDDIITRSGIKNNLYVHLDTLQELGVLEWRTRERILLKLMPDGTPVELEAAGPWRKIRVADPKPMEVSRTPPQGKPLRRFTEKSELDPESVVALEENSAPIRENRTVYPSSVIDPDESNRLLVSGINSRKLGSRVTVGPWKGFQIYQLTLEERKTCPSTCYHLLTCYGNGMPFARRHKHGPALETKLPVELRELQKKHPNGFVVRLHVLGDFYSTEYVALWEEFLEEFPALHVFGYTNWQAGTTIGDVIIELRDRRWDRFAIRTSAKTALETGATTTWKLPEGKTAAGGTVCLAQRVEDQCCGSCGLCWLPKFKEETITFIGHGNSRPGRPSTTLYTKPPLAEKPWPVEFVEAEKKESIPLTGKVQRRCSCGKIFQGNLKGPFLCPECMSSLSEVYKGT